MTATVLQGLVPANDSNTSSSTSTNSGTTGTGTATGTTPSGTTASTTKATAAKKAYADRQKKKRDQAQASKSLKQAGQKTTSRQSISNTSQTMAANSGSTMANSGGGTGKSLTGSGAAGLSMLPFGIASGAGLDGTSGAAGADGATGTRAEVGKDCKKDESSTGSTRSTGSGSGSGNASNVATTFNRAILQFATDRQGEQVGNGECWTLAAEAVKAAGARQPIMYNFGAEIPLRSALPGDILQFESALFVRANGWTRMGYPNHTAIVYTVEGDRITLLNQNVNGSRVVQISVINLGELQSGSITAYRAIAR